MDKQQAKDIVKDTLGNAFDKGRFTHFVRNLLNKIDESKAFQARGYVPESYKKYVKTYERLATYTDPEGLKIDILIVYLESDTTLERARTAQRNFIARYLKDRDQKDAGLVAFVSPDPSDWRFSLVKMDYRFEEGKKGKIKVKEEFTPARRWSFLVGINENSHTAQARLFPIMADDGNPPTLAELEEAFNIETVTKEFFIEYRNLFIRVKEALDAIVKKDAAIRDNFAKNDVNTVDFSKKLLGQIVFLYFLQKKGWFGVAKGAAWGTGSKQFLRELFDKKHGDYKNFFNDILEPLFYDALRNDRSHDDHYYSRFNCKIPFLNGGLFDPIKGYDWVNTDIIIPNELFSNKKRTKEGDIGDGVLDIFDRYNFTVKEDEPMEKEVAIDPELLGKAYEKFNAIRPDNFEEYRKALKSGKKGEESKFNKQFGVYYTPREIVHYMCQQSLVNYLAAQLDGGAVIYEKPGEKQTDLVANTGKKGQLDLTIEHAEKPIILKEDIETLIHYSERIAENEEIAIIKKKNIIAGKQKSAKIKSFLTENIQDNAKEIDEILASIKVCDPAIGSGAFPVGMMAEIIRVRSVLSNFIKDDDRTIYKFKRDCIENSLYGVDIDSGAVEIAKLRLWLSLVVDEDDIKNIKPLPNLDYKILCGNSLLGLPEDILPDTEISKDIEEKKKQYFSTTSPSEKNKIRETINGLFSQLLDNIKKYDRTIADISFDFHTHFSEVFYEKGGFDVVIANPPYDVYEGHRKEEIAEIRKIKTFNIAKSGKLNAYKLFLAKSIVLQKPAGILCQIFQNSFLADTSAKLLRKYFLENQRVINIYSFPERDDIRRRVFESAKMSVCILISQNCKKDQYSFLLNIYHDKLMKESKQSLLTNTSILSLDPEGATIPLISNEEKLIIEKLTKLPKLLNIAYCYQGEINLTTHKSLLRTEKEKNAPVVKGAAIQKWYFKEKMSQGEIVYLDDNKYLKMNEGKKSKHHNLSRIVTQGITGVDEKYRLKATYLERGIYCAHSTNYILIYDKNIGYQYVLALINSWLLNWYFKIFSTNSNVNSYEVNNIPVVIATEKQACLINLVDKILFISKSNDYQQNLAKQAKVKEYEKEIDQMVYKLYGLTPEEIAIVEGQK